MTAKEVLAELKSLGTEQARKIYARHGGGSVNAFGVSFANLYALRRKIKVDHALALQLWDAGYFEACALATYIADPRQADAKILDKWASECTDQGIAGEFGGFAARCADGVKRAREWIKDKGEFTQVAGWSTLGAAMKAGTDGMSAKDTLALLDRIEKSIHKSPNRAREAMNRALIAIGSYRADVRQEAIAAAKRIGPVDIDHGETGCKTPDAASYIQKAVEHQAKRATAAK